MHGALPPLQEDLPCPEQASSSLGKVFFALIAAAFNIDRGLARALSGSSTGALLYMQESMPAGAFSSVLL